MKCSIMRADKAAILLTLAAGLSVSACATGGEKRGAMQRDGSLAEAAATPLEDVNLKRIQIPPVLQHAVANPYDPAGMGNCRGIAAEVARLDAALGPDADEPPPPDTRSDMERTAGDAHSAAVTVVREGVKSVIPFRGWVRQLSGAARQEKQVQEAIYAGGVRRGYLKGVGMRLNCAPPAAPSWFKPTRARAAPAPTPARQAARPAPARR
jgi:hypothetical protein